MNPRIQVSILGAGAAVLAAVLVLRLRSRPDASPSPAPSSVVESAAPAPRSGGVRHGPVSGTAAAFVWSQVLTNDLHVYIRNLRAVECPETTLRDIIVGEVNRLFAPREAPFRVKDESLVPKPSETDPEKRRRRRADYERRRNLRLVEKEKAAVIRELLGFDIPLEPLRGWYSRSYERMESAINGVPAEKRERVREILEAYWELSDKLNDESDVSNKGRDAAFVERYRENNERRRLALSQVLTPVEIEDFEMRASSVAERLRMQLGPMQPTEAEFREIYRLRRDIEEPFGGTMTLNDTTDPKVDPEAENRYRQQLGTVLGPERTGVYDQVQSEPYRNLLRLQERFGLAEDAVQQAFDLLKQAQPVSVTTQVYENGQVVQRQVQMPAGRPPTEQWNQLRGVLGDQAFLVLEAMVPEAPQSYPNGTVFGVPLSLPAPVSVPVRP